jgi:predicted dehydrogenase
MNSGPEPASGPAVGAAVVGLGVGADHARALARHPEAALRLLYDLDPARAAALAGELGALAVDNFDAVLHADNVALVVVASYDHDHFGQVTGALRAGKHVFAEKPLCQSLDELRGIKETWRRSAGLHLRSNLVLRSAPLYGWLRAFIADGNLGEIYAFDGDYLYGRIEKIVDGWRGRSPGYSPLKGGGIHLVDLMLWLTGQQPHAVLAAGNRIATAAGPSSFNDYVAATYRFPSGLIGRITVNLGSVHRHQHVVRIFGTRGTFIYDDAGARLHLSRDPSLGAKPVELDPLPASKGVLLPGIVDGIRAGRRDETATQVEIDAMSVCLAGDLALASGSTIAIDYV